MLHLHCRRIRCNFTPTTHKLRNGRNSTRLTRPKACTTFLSNRNNHLHTTPSRISSRGRLQVLKYCQANLVCHNTTTLERRPAHQSLRLWLITIRQLSFNNLCNTNPRFPWHSPHFPHHTPQVSQTFIDPARLKRLSHPKKFQARWSTHMVNTFGLSRVRLRTLGQANLWKQETLFSISPGG